MPKYGSNNTDKKPKHFSQTEKNLLNKLSKGKKLITVSVTRTIEASTFQI